MILNLPRKANKCCKFSSFREQRTRTASAAIPHPLNLSFVASLPLQTSQLIKAHLETLLENQIIPAHRSFSSLYLRASHVDFVANCPFEEGDQITFYLLCLLGVPTLIFVNNPTLWPWPFLCTIYRLRINHIN